MSPSEASTGSGPAMSEVPSRRKRTARACDACSRRKIHCDAAVPRCDWCRHHDMDCTYDRPLGKRQKKQVRATSQGTTSTGASRDSSLAQAIRDPRDCPGNPYSGKGVYPLSQPIQSKAYGTLHFAGCLLGNVSSPSGIPLFSPEGQRWVESVTGEELSFDCGFDFTAGKPRLDLTAQWFSASSINCLTRPNVGLPPKSAVEGYLRQYNANVSKRAIFPVFDPFLFPHTITRAYQDPLNFEHEPSAKAGVLVFTILANLLDAAELPHEGDQLDLYVAQASKLLPYIVAERTLEGTEAIVGLTLYTVFTGDTEMAAMRMALAVAAVTHIGGHVCPDLAPESLNDPSPEVIIAKHVRNLFWIAFNLDVMVAIHAGMPLSFSHDFCDLTLPPGYLDTLYPTNYGDSEPDAPFIPTFAGDLRLAIIQAKAHVKLYSCQAVQKPDAELLRDIRELDMELEVWRQSVPPMYRPTWVHSGQLPPNAPHNAVILRLLFYYTVTLIHRASSRCQAWSNMQPRWDFDALGSSLTLSVEASRSCLLFMSEVADSVSGNFFSTLVIFPMTSFIILFCNALLNPSDPQAASDIRLLEQVPLIIKRLRLRNLSVMEMTRLGHIDEFAMELARLGKCAISKANRERAVENTTYSSSGGGNVYTPYHTATSTGLSTSGHSTPHTGPLSPRIYF